jgi:hypothetical protein
MLAMPTLRAREAKAARKPQNSRCSPGANLFLVPLDGTGSWYRYHALSTVFLRSHVSEAEALPLYRAGSHWFEQNGLLDDAIH